MRTCRAKGTTGQALPAVLHGRYFVASDYNFDGGKCLLKKKVAGVVG